MTRDVIKVMLCYVTSGSVAFRLALHCWPTYPHLGFEYTMGSPADERRLKVLTVCGSLKVLPFRSLCIQKNYLSHDPGWSIQSTRIG